MSPGTSLLQEKKLSRNEGAKKPMPEAKHAGQLEAHDLQGKNMSSQNTPSQSVPC